jgi:hypothetical protein
LKTSSDICGFRVDPDPVGGFCVDPAGGFCVVPACGFGVDPACGPPAADTIPITHMTVAAATAKTNGLDHCFMFVPLGPEILFQIANCRLQIAD